MRGGKGLKGSMTVEMSVIVPLVLLLIMGCILAAFYYHDKNILSGAAYETAVVGSTKAREKDGAGEDELYRLFGERIKGKCILFARASPQISVTNEQVEVQARARRSGMSILVQKRARVTDPEKFIRDRRRITTKWNEK